MSTVEIVAIAAIAWILFSRPSSGGYYRSGSGSVQRIVVPGVGSYVSGPSGTLVTLAQTLFNPLLQQRTAGAAGSSAIGPSAAAPPGTTFTPYDPNVAAPPAALPVELGPIDPTIMNPSLDPSFQPPSFYFSDPSGALLS